MDREKRRTNKIRGGKIKMETEVQKIGEINWSTFTSNYVKIEEGEPIDLELTNWRQTEEDFNGEKIDGIRLDVTSENSVKVEKNFVITSKRLITALKLHIVNSERMGNKSFRVRILKSGKGFSSWLIWALLFLVVAIVAAILGFGLIAGVSLTIAKWLAVIFVILFIISVIAHVVKQA